MRRVSPVRRVLLAGLVLAGCETSRIDRSATVTVSGRILRADGSPAAGLTVGLEREPSAGEIVTGLLLVPLTLFTACLAEPPPALCKGRDVRRATTGADGAYAFELKGSDIQTSFGNARTMSLGAELPPAAGETAGPAVTASFKVQTGDLVLKDLQMWEPEVTIAAGRTGWEPLAGAGAYRVGVEDAAGQLVWSFDSRGREVTFDPRILEDTTGSVAVIAASGTTAEGTTVSVRRRSARVGYRSATGPPTSRGRPCTLSPPVAPAARCPLTDGDFGNEIPRPPTTSGATVSTVPVTASATVDLGRAIDVSLIVVRGCSCGLERSVDGQAWTAVGRASGLTAVVPSPTAPARFVRVSGNIADLREVSVWEAGAARAQAPSVTSPATAGPLAALTEVTAATPAGGSSRQGPALVALAALLAAAIAAAAASVRARPPPTGR